MYTTWKEMTLCLNPGATTSLLRDLKDYLLFLKPQFFYQEKKNMGCYKVSMNSLV